MSAVQITGAEMAAMVRDAKLVRARLAEQGFRPVAVWSVWSMVDSAGKCPYGKAWQERARQNPPAAVVEDVIPAALNTGILCDGLRAIDIDVDDPVISGAIRELAVQMLGEAPLRSRAGSPRCLLLYRAAVGEPPKLKVTGTLGAVEVLGRGQHFVVHGDHPKGGRYICSGVWSLGRLTPVTEERIAAFLKAAGPVIEATAGIENITSKAAHNASQQRTAPLASVVSALAAIPNDATSDWDFWTKIGMATWVATGGDEDGFDAFDGWSSRNPAYEHNATRARWDGIASSPPSGIGVGTLYYLARKADADRRLPESTAFKEFGPMADEPAADDANELLAELERLARDEEPGPTIGGFASDGTDDVDDAFSASAPAYSEEALALEFSAKHVGQVIYVKAWRRWLTWDGCRWVEDKKLVVRGLVRELVRENAARVASGGTEQGARIAQRLACEKVVSAVERLVPADVRHSRTAEKFDVDPWALNTPNGVVDLHTGKIQKHRRGEMVTKVTGVAPDAAYKPVRWLQFLNEFCRGDEELIRYLQRWAGYTLTGVANEHAIIFFVGPGGNGKSVLVNTLAAAMGSYATTAMADIITVGRNDQHPTHLAALRGARMVSVMETEQGRQLAEGRLKSLTGGDTISARVMRGDPFEFKPICKIYVTTNFRPDLRNPGHAMRRRIHLVPCDYVPKVPDLSLEDSLKEELGGILAWMIEGCLMWARDRLAKPSVVQAATDEYFSDQDTLGKWLGERCEPGESFSEGTRVLFSSWSNFAREVGVVPGTEKAFSEGLARLYIKKRISAGFVFNGLRLLPEAEPGAGLLA